MFSLAEYYSQFGGELVLADKAFPKLLWIGISTTPSSLCAEVRDPEIPWK